MTTNLRVDGARLWASLMEMAQIGATEKGGVCRIAATDLDRRGRQLFTQWVEALGCEVRIDAIGNMFARRPGFDADALPVATGSHLDSQPTGGKFDGAYGVLAGVEVLRTLNDNDVQTNAPIEVLVWTNEEGARFPPAMMGSGVYVGEFELEATRATRDHDGVTIGDALDAIGYTGPLAPGHQRYAAFFETHIEQGPILEAREKTIGVVTGVQGIKWYDVTIIGAEAHAGPTPMDLRRDALLGAAQLCCRINELALVHAPHGRSTIGELHVSPSSRNTIPGSVRMTVDLRHPDGDSLEDMSTALSKIAQELEVASGLEIDVKCIWTSPPVSFDEACVTAVRDAAAASRLGFMDIVSGAGHDAVYMSRVAPTAMIFVPCADGVSHNEAESAQPSDLEAGTNVLLHAMLERAGVPHQ
jgi:beta-ureidopropionase / N-carbamoyl-L-amino-acid hydrolase